MTTLASIESAQNFQKWSFGRLDTPRMPSDKPPPKGPWSEEPDKVQWIDPATGLDCLILRNHFGALCGYVGLPPGHRYHEVGYDDVPYDELDVHGGLTFASFCSPSEEPDSICHTPAPGRPDKVWWLGFDCAHAFDLAPLMHHDAFPGEEYRDMGYVIDEVTGLAKDLTELDGFFRRLLRHVWR